MDTTTGGTEIIDLGIGQPQDAVLPREALRQAAAAALAGPDQPYLQYGPEQGMPSLLQTLAAFLTRHYGHPVDPATLLITNGASHGLDLVLARCTRPGDTVVVESPSYFFGLDVLRQRGVRPVAVPVDGDGMRVDDLERVLQTHEPALVYTIPVLHNPTGVTLSGPRRARLRELADRHHVPIVADEVYQLTATPDRVPPPLRRDPAPHVLSLGSFAKILGPGVRLGWIEAEPDRIAHLADDAVLRSGGGASPMTGAIVEAAIRLGLQDRFLDAIREVYDNRRRCAETTLRRTLPDRIRVRYPRGGYYVWLELPGHADPAAVRADARAAGVDYRPGEIFSVDGSLTNCLRLCFTYYPEDTLVPALERLAKVLSAHC
ncbi:PLP-dependent aminotransferase family protein [Dactylosporangium vinaceum]|uniref:PLP-dependent aminotransferase family protein n=1 Tax=Dactylosporangium vinaceum TaxID=53362 RepID=A0ABV5MS90_9ACTN|nr:PLP-dependent aminotransferase family protein [Dactylosporangium vinaceum]UAC00213.1 PLP-dependent aminotransferase family protein [Dactylosporangium vinaceum]